MVINPKIWIQKAKNKNKKKSLIISSSTLWSRDKKTKMILT
jgi:hypothetical protein